MDEQIVEPAVPTSPLGLPDAFDNLDVMWRLAFDKTPLLQAHRAADAAGLSLPCATAAEFESRMNDLVEMIKALQVADESLVAPAKDLPREQSLNRMMAFLETRLPDVELQRAKVAVGVLRSLTDIRVAFAHSHAGSKLPPALDRLGLDSPIVSYSETWDRIRLKGIQALNAIRDAVRPLAM